MVDRQPDAVSEAIARCVVFKADVVAQDKTESRGVRECLNYGHTLAHAIEKLSGYGTYSHGHAVAEGMRFAARMGMRLADMPVRASPGARDSCSTTWACPSLTGRLPRRRCSMS